MGSIFLAVLAYRLIVVKKKKKEMAGLGKAEFLL